MLQYSYHISHLLEINFKLFLFLQENGEFCNMVTYIIYTKESDGL